MVNFNQLHKADIILTTQRNHPVSAGIRAATNSIISHSKLVFILSFLLFSSGCGAIYRSGFVPVPAQPVSGPIEIGSEWVEIVPPKPLKPYGTIQNIKIGFKDYSDPYTDEMGEILNLKDGRQTRVEAILYDDRGESYELHISGVGGGVRLSRPSITKVVDGKEDTFYNEFPSDRTYPKLRIRSEIPLKCEFIDWSGWNNK